MDLYQHGKKRNREYYTKALEASAKRRQIAEAAAQDAYADVVMAMPRPTTVPVPSRGRLGYTTVARTRGAYGSGEMKYFNSEKELTTLVANRDWTGTEFDPGVVPVASMNTLFAPTVGSAINQRIGKSAKVFKIKIKGLIWVPFNANQTGGLNAAAIRLALVQDNQTNGTQAQGEQVFTPAVTNSPIVSVNSFQNIDNFGRFKVLKDKIIVVQNPNMSYDGANIEMGGLTRPFKWNLNFPGGIDVRFNAVNGGTVSNIVDHSWHIYANATSTALGAQISYTCRVCFKE